MDRADPCGPGVGLDGRGPDDPAGGVGGGGGPPGGRVPDPFGGYSVLDFRSYPLGGTETYAKRSVLWIPADPDYPGHDGRLGQLTIKLQRARGYGRVVEVGTYIVSPDTPEPKDYGCPAFWLYKVADDADDESANAEPYRAVVGPYLQRCGCMAGRCGLACKHADAIWMLMEQGDIPDRSPL